MPPDGCPQRCSLEWCVIQTWWIASFSVSQSGVELVITTPRSGWGLVCALGRRDRTGGGQDLLLSPSKRFKDRLRYQSSNLVPLAFDFRLACPLLPDRNIDDTAMR